MSSRRTSLTRRVLVLSTALLCASALNMATTEAAPPVAPSCVEDVRTGYTPTANGSGASYWSDDGRYVAFTASSVNDPSDTNGAFTHAVVRDRTGPPTVGALDIASQMTDGTQLGVNATALQVSDDGNFVLFASTGAFEVGDTNLVVDVFLRDRLLDETTRVDVGTGGAQLVNGAATATMSADGRYVVFTTAQSLDGLDGDSVTDVYRYDTQSDTTVLVSVDDDELEIANAATLIGVDATGNIIYFSVAGPTTYHVRNITGPGNAGTTTLMPAEAGFITRPGTSLVINTATPHAAADTDFSIDAYLFDIGSSVWTLISDPALGLPTGIPFFASSASTDLNFVSLGYNDGNAASVVVDRTGGTFRYAAQSAASVSDDGTEVLASGIVYRVGRTNLYTVAPTSVTAGNSASVTVTGREFITGTTFDFGAGLTVSNLVLAGNQATMTVTASVSAAAGSRAVAVTQGGSGCVATLASAITVTVFGAPTVTAVGPSFLDGPALIRPNTNTAVQIAGSNFRSGAVASSPLAVQSTTFNSSTGLSAVVNSTGATEGFKSLTVTNTDTKSDTLSEAMLVRSSRGEFHSVGPVRVLDTRSGAPIGTKGTRDVQVAGAGGVPSTGVRAVLMNVTVAGPTAPSYLTIFPTGTPRPNSSSLNFVAGQAVPNLVTATVGADGKVTIYNDAGSTHVLFDVVGWYSDVGTTYGGTFVGLSPTRVLDTRFDFDTPLGAEEYIILPVVVPGSPVSAVMMNVTVTAPTAPSYLTIWPNGSDLPNASSLNFVPGQTVPNLVVAPIGEDGSVNIYNFAGDTEVIVDVVGVFEDGTVEIFDGQYEAVQPFRALDSRVTSAPVGFNSTVSLDVRTIGVPDDASVLMMNVTATGPTADGYLAVFPGDEGTPDTSNLNFKAGQTVPNAVAMRIGADRRVNFYNAYGSTHLIVDVTGWYRPGYAVGTQFSLSSTPSLDSTAVQTNAAPLLQPSVTDWLRPTAHVTRRETTTRLDR